MPPEDMPPGGIQLDDVDGQWDAWRPDQAAARLAPVTAAGSGRVWPVDSPAFGQTYQTWASEPDPSRIRGRVYRLDVFREPARDGHWAFRRDQQITLPYERVIRRDAAGIPYLVPEIVQLFKANNPRSHDQADFAAALRLLTSAGAAWLRAMLQWLHPGHAWIDAL
jgi:hypothetical protein